MKPRPALLLAVLLYLGLDLALPMPPGGFSVTDPVEACRSRGCATEASPVAHRRLPPGTSAPRPTVRGTRPIGPAAVAERMRRALPDESDRSAPPSSIDDD